MTAFTESTVETAVPAWLEATGWRIAHGADMAPEMPTAERREYGEAVIFQWPRDIPLPRLISGELRVKDAERFLKEKGL